MKINSVKLLDTDISLKEGDEIKIIIAELNRDGITHETHTCRVLRGGGTYYLADLDSNKVLVSAELGSKFVPSINNKILKGSFSLALEEGSSEYWENKVLEEAQECLQNFVGSENDSEVKSKIKESMKNLPSYEKFEEAFVNSLLNGIEFTR